MDANVVLSALLHILEKENATAEMHLLKSGDVSIEPTSYDNWNGGITSYTITIGLMPSEYAAQLANLELMERNILSAAHLLFRSIQGEGFEKVAIVPKMVLEPIGEGISREKLETVLNSLEMQKSLMVAVSTGGPSIKSVNQEYKQRHQEILRDLGDLGLKYPVVYDDLWKWYGHWSAGSLPTYVSRKAFLSSLFDPLVESIKKKIDATGAAYVQAPITGWPRVDRTTAKTGDALANAKNEEDFQTVGLLCRENLITLSSIVYQADKHRAFTDQEPSSTDAKRMLDAYFSCELQGSNDEEMRHFAKSANALANALTHKRTANRILAGICLSATNAVVSIARIIESEHGTA
jgi:hypothetical protein